MAVATLASSLGESFRGELIGAADDGYDEARAVWNGAIDRRPALIARCAGVADVVAALRFARERGLPLSVRGGGHGVAGHAVIDDGIVIDLSPMRGIHVDARTRTARAQAGVLWGELDRETQLHGLATTGGIVTHTGIAGLTLGGGIGWLMHKHGATVDNLLSAQVVTAEGDVVTASEDENPELFWGLRGGGGNFGIVTSFEFRLHPLGPTILGGPLFYPLEQAADVLAAHADLVADAPDELTTILNFRLAPPLPVVPEEVQGRPVIAVISCWAGDLDAGDRYLQPLREAGDVLVDALVPRPYTALQLLFNPGVPHGWHYYWRSCEVGQLTGDAGDVLAARTFDITSPRSYTIAFHLGGAMSRVDPEATSFAQRATGFNVNVNGVWLPDDPEPQRHVDWARGLFAELSAASPGRVYVNFLGDEGQERVRAAYGAAKYERLAALKAVWDPENAFRSTQNIRPSAST